LPPDATPHVVVLSSLFPSSVQPHAGLFVRERMFRVGRALPLCVVAPVPWSPLDALLRRWRPGFRPGAPRHERQDGYDVWYPRFLSVPGAFKRADGMLMALCALPRLRALRRAGRLDVIDAHFGYPDGYAATLLGRWLGVPVTITLRGTESRHARAPALRRRLQAGLHAAARVFAVSESLRAVALALGLSPERVRVVGNGVETTRFAPQDRTAARAQLRIAAAAKVIVSVGGLTERKGFHRVIDCLPALRVRHPSLVYLIVGGPSAEGDWSTRLRVQVDALGLGDCVRFLGALPSAALATPLSAADVFVLATANEGWANVFLEAMACGLPVVTTDVGGNAEVVCNGALGVLVPFATTADLTPRLTSAIDAALTGSWDRAAIRAYAQANVWERRVDVLVEELCAAAARKAAPPARPEPPGTLRAPLQS
jgi:teichuronic acid biosynthesis glycosyltransferase TuaC